MTGKQILRGHEAAFSAARIRAHLERVNPYAGGYVDDSGRAHGSDGRMIPKPKAPLVVVHVETRQQRRLKARQALKADVTLAVAKVWDDVTDGRGVVLVDGKALPTRGGKKRP